MRPILAIVLHTDLTMKAAGVYGGDPLAKWESVGVLKIVRSIKAANEFVTLFALPEELV